MHSKQKEVRNNVQISNVSNFQMTHETEFTTADIVILKVVKKKKDNKFFLQMRHFFYVGKTSNLAIGSGLTSEFAVCRRELQGLILKIYT